jgi:hypothetical protein
MSLTSEFESMLFENKEEIPQGAYVKMMNELKEKHEKEKKESDMYVILYLKKQLWVQYENGSLDIQMKCEQEEPQKQKTYVKLSSNQYEHLQEQLPKPLTYSPHLIEYNELKVVCHQRAYGHDVHEHTETIIVEGPKKCGGCIADECGCCECGDDFQIVSIPVRYKNIYIITSIERI